MLVTFIMETCSGYGLSKRKVCIKFNCSVYKIVNYAHVTILLPSMSNKSLKFHLFVWAFLIYLQTVITLWPNNYFENMNCMVLSILLRAGLVQKFLVQAFSLFGPADGLLVYCF